MFRKRAFWIVLIVLVLAGGGGYVAYANRLIPGFGPAEAKEAETVLGTATVTRGDISITADGTGMLVASSEVELAFDASGTLVELLVKVGDRVQAGDVLGWIDDADARNAVTDAELGVIQAEQALEEARDTAALAQAVAQTELNVAQAEANLVTAQRELEDLLTWAPDETEVEISKANLAISRASYQNTVSKASLRNAQIASTRIKLEQAIRDLEKARVDYATAMDAARDWERNIESTRERAAETLQNVQDSLEIAQASYDLAMIDSNAIDVQSAWIKVLDAQEALDALQTAPDDQEIATAQLKIQELEVALGKARLDLADAQEALTEADTAEAEITLQQAQLKLASAQATLEGTTLVAPISGTVVELLVEVGEKVNGTVIVLANLDLPVVQFWVEESDLGSVAVGHPVRIVFEALPDLNYDGEIVRVDPVLVSVGNTPAVQAWASINVSAHPVSLLGDMNVEVEIVAGEVLNAVLVPVQALREVAEGRYAAFVVQPSGELEMRLVEVGLKDFVNAEVLSGLEPGEEVSTGERTTSSGSSAPTTTQPQPPGGGAMRFLGG